ncbi:MAG TPA: hypothetical protein ENI95_02750, partial [Chloroflexi bacterium]|nr:hypothetical protein [Chloroflexota bacterium]
MRERLRPILPDLIIVAFLLAVPLLFFLPQTVGGKTLLPVDNLFQWEPYRSLADEYGIGRPHNGLLSDLILENVPWRQFVHEQVAAGELPLWQPYILAGAPFLAAGQSLTLYPFSLLFLILPLPTAYGWFAVSQLWIAAVNMYVLARVLGIRRFGGAVAALAYQLSGFYMVSVVFPMIIAAAAWLPLELAMIELTLRQGKALGGQPATIPWVAIGAIGLGMAALAGHVEALYFTLLVMAFYALWRLAAGVIAGRAEAGVWKRAIRRAAWLAALVGLGLALGAIQSLPSYELASRSFREGAVTLEQVRGWAYPARRLIAFFIPNFFGNPAHHSILDVFTWRRVPLTVNAYGDPVTSTDWGIKNYVEGGAYMGLLPMALALIAVAHWLVGRLPYRRARRAVPIRNVGREEPGRPYRAIFGTLALLSVSFVFGTPTYALLYYGLPFINQSHSPFRWVWPLTLSVALLAGFAVELMRPPTWRLGGSREVPLQDRLAELLGRGGIIGGGLIVAALAGSRAFYSRIADPVQRVFEGLALAPNAFPDGRSFYSYQFWNFALFALMLILSGIVLLAARRGTTFGEVAGRLKMQRAVPDALRYRPLWKPLAVLVVIADLGAATWGFYPANDPALLEVVPPSIAWLRGQMDESDPWRFIAYEEPGADTMNANIGWLHGLQDASGYDSLIPGQYADYMRLIQPQGDLLYNRIAPLYSTYPQALDSPLLDLLNVRYVVTERPIENPRYELAYQDEAVLIYENAGAMPRAFTLPAFSTVYYGADGDPALPSFEEQATRLDVRQYVLVALDDSPPPIPENTLIGLNGHPAPARITAYTPNQILVDVQVERQSWLIVTDSNFPGWKAWVRPFGEGEEAEQEAEVWPVDGNFRGVLLEPGAWTVRMKYSPDSVKLGGFISFMAGMTIVFAAAVWVWRYAYREEAEASEAKRVAKNSLAPIVLNLFNKGILFAFAFISLRILGPAGSGKYQYAVVIWGWFEIFSNFGL